MEAIQEIVNAIAGTISEFIFEIVRLVLYYLFAGVGIWIIATTLNAVPIWPKPIAEWLIELKTWRGVMMGPLLMIPLVGVALVLMSLIQFIILL